MAISKAVMEGRQARVPQTSEVAHSETFNLDLLNLKELATNLQSSIRNRRPSSRFFVWGGERQLAKQQLDIRQLEMVLHEIQLLEMTAEQMARTKAKMFLMPEMVDSIINGHRAELELQKHKFYDALQEVKDNAYLRQTAIRKAKAEAESIETENYINKLIGEAKAQAIRAGARAEEARAGMLEKLKAEMDMDNISASQAFVLAKALNPSDQSDVDFAMKERMFEEDLKKAREQNRLHKAEADLREHSVKRTIGENEEVSGGFGED